MKGKNMDIQTLAESLRDAYLPTNVREDLHGTRAEYLSGSIIPSDVLAYSGQGAILATNKGDLIDCSSMTVNCILGQNDPWVNANLLAYINSGRPSFLTTRIGGDMYYKVARRLLDVTGYSEDVINHRQSNGTDVTELAILAAYKYDVRNRTTLVSFEGSYHGQGLTAYHASHLQRKHRFFIHDSDMVFLDQPTHVENIDDNTALSSHDEAILQKLRELSSTVFAVILEPIQVNNSVNTPSRAFIVELQKVCEEYEIALVFDEVQTGMGWLGVMTAAQRYGVRPNLLAISKALTSGNGPLSALISDKQYQDIPDGTAAKTNGADIRSLVAANAVMDRLLGVAEERIPSTIPDEFASELKVGLLDSHAPKAEKIKNGLDKLREKYPGLIGQIKGDGFIRGIQLSGDDYEMNVKKTKMLQQELFDNGAFLRHSKDTLIVKPPIVIKNSELDRVFEIMDKTFERHA